MMMKLLSIVTFLPLTAIAALHIYRGFGGLWPAETTKALIDTVGGAPGMTRMPSLAATLTVAGLICASALFALASRLQLEGLRRLFVRAALATIALVFLVRGGAGYLAEWRSLTMSEPFATLDVTLYSPLCLTFGASFLALFFVGPKFKKNEE
jgi:hypothetical protein